MNNKIGGHTAFAHLSGKERKETEAVAYKKSQFVRAAWKTLKNRAQFSEDPDPSFTRRFDKLQAVGVPLTPEERAGGPGHDHELSADQVFLIAVALVLMDSGLGLGTVGFFIHHARASLIDQYTRIMNEMKKEDRTVWLMLQNRDLQELYPTRKQTGIAGWVGKGPAPLIVNPKYAFGKEARNKLLDEYTSDSSHNHVLIIELAHLASTLTENLKHAPILRRGRPK
ncbi:hypothetical protein ACMAUO_11755 [Gluconacetobacter sp. Hr-1-5]|uniref:hypothetical protein n=1 Tax=Gluconacetobacter sp. Hr-1-5 TaxID=3395370 RepID=UPI003B51BF59